MSNEELCSVLLKWLQTFQLSSRREISTVDDLTDGVVMAQVLNEIAPEWFSKNWLSKIKLDVAEDNWRLKVSNLKKIVTAVYDYYQEYVNQNISFVKPDAVSIGEHKDVVETVKLLQLILGCAVNCEKKQEYIKQIMLMEESVQNVIMQLIQELETLSGSITMSLCSNLNAMDGEGRVDDVGSVDIGGCERVGVSASSDGMVDGGSGVRLGVETSINRLLRELRSVAEAKERLTFRCTQLQSQVSALQEEKQNVADEKKVLEERLEHTMCTLSKDNGLRKQIDALKEEVFKLETARDDYRVKLAMQEKEMEELQTKFDSLQRAAAEARHLKDEVDILREDADKAEKLESAVKSYKKKLEELSELKREMKLLEEKNLTYVQQTLELEEELKKANVWKTQAEMYKKQYLEARNSLNEETKKCDKVEFENIKLQEKMNALQKEKERLIVERDSLKEANEELLCSKLQLKEEDLANNSANAAIAVGLPTAATLGSSSSSSSAAAAARVASSSVVDNNNTDLVSNGMVSVIELKRELLRLQHENTLLKGNRKQSDDEKLPLLQAMFEDTSQQNKQLRNECRLANQRILQLEAELGELQFDGKTTTTTTTTTATATATATAMTTAATTTNVSHQVGIKELHDQLQLEKGLRFSESAEKDRLALELKHLKSVLFEQITRKDQEYEDLEEKHRKCLEKARNVAKSLDCVESLTSAIVENDSSVRRKATHKAAETVDELEKHCKQVKLAGDTEEKLVITAFYNLIQKKNQECVDHRLMGVGGGGGGGGGGGNNTTTTVAANSANIVKHRVSSIRRAR